jgi:hypothetical protein
VLSVGPVVGLVNLHFLALSSGRRRGLFGALRRADRLVVLWIVLLGGTGFLQLALRAAFCLASRIVS